MSKRVLIEGEGALGEAVIDQRANCPTFRITRCVGVCDSACLVSSAGQRARARGL